MSEEYGLKFVVNGEDYDKIKKSLNEQIEDLQQKVEQLEKEKNSLMYSLTLVRQKWNNDKARYRRKAKVYREQRNQLENIRKEAITYILTHCEIIRHEKENVDEVGNVNGADLLNILNKGDNK